VAKYLPVTKLGEAQGHSGFEVEEGLRTIDPENSLLLWDSRLVGGQACYMDGYRY
jgi:hypothetical protein